MANLEIERKFLIRLPEGKSAYVAMLRRYYGDNLQFCKITQTYLTSEEGERRVRKSVTAGRIEFFYTEKHTISGMSRIEREHKITREEYEKYLQEADPALHPIEKMRYIFEYLGRICELDMYPFSKDKAILEVELPSEKTYLELPYFVSVIKEVTLDAAYKNRNLARNPWFI